MKGRAVHIRQIMYFLAGGLTSALIDVGLMAWLLHLHFPPLLAATVGFAAGLLVNYAFHTLVTFASAFTAGAFARFMTVVFLNYLITLALISFTVAFVHTTLIDSALAGKIVALPLVAINGFLLSKFWIYKPAAHRR